MKNRPKLLIPATLTAALVIFAVIYIWPFVFRHHYTEEDKADYDTLYGIGEMAMYTPATLENSLLFADIVMEATVLTDGMEKEWVRYSTAFPGTNIKVPRTKYTTHATSFTLEVDEVWYGDYGKPTIDVILHGKVPYNGIKPLKGDRILIMIYQCESELLGKYYQTTPGDERGVFIINPPDNTLFSLSREKEFTVYDGTSLEEMRQTIEELTSSH